jgi:hypothetical protein
VSLRLRGRLLAYFTPNSRGFYSFLTVFTAFSRNRTSTFDFKTSTFSLIKSGAAQNYFKAGAASVSEGIAKRRFPAVNRAVKT